VADLHCFTNEIDTYVAASLEDALAAEREHTGMRPEDQDPETWEQLAEDHELGIWLDEELKNHATKTCAEWAAERGRGFLCTSEY
jgi:hypothetical protein